MITSRQVFIVFTHKYQTSLFNFILLSLIILVMVPSSVKALPTPNFCFALSDSDNTLHTMLFDGSAQAEAPNASGVPQIETIAFQPDTQILYAVDADQFGILNYDFTDLANGGVFTDVGAGLGNVNGASGPFAVTDVDSMAFDPISGCYMLSIEMMALV